MSTPRNTPSGPAVSYRLIAGAFIGGVCTLVLVPVFRDIFAQLSSVFLALHPQGGPYGDHLVTLLETVDFALIVLPIASTLGLVVVAYAWLGTLGAVLTIGLSSTATGMLAGRPAAVLTFLVCAVVLTALWTVTERLRTADRSRGVDTDFGGW